MIRSLADATAKLDSCATDARETMARLGIPDTPQNFWIWHTYHTGANPDLNRAIDILLSNRREFTEQTNEEIFDRFLGTARESEIIRETTRHVLKALDALTQFIREADFGANAYKKTLSGLASEMVAGRPLAELIDNLMRETKTIETQSELLHQRLARSSTTIRELRQSLEDVQREALTDALTGIANRKLFDTALRQAAMDAMETGEALSLLLIDIDHFKRFNDSFGHQTGDEVLKLLARTLMTNMRDIDTPARYGGEEFAVILPHADLAMAVAIAERIRAALSEKRVVMRQSGQDCGAVTASIGVAQFEPGEPLGALIARADQALYSAKREGRNRTVAAPADG